MLTFGTVVPLVALALTITGVKGDHPGFKARVTQHALDYASQQAMDALVVHVPTLSIPDHSGSYQHLDYRVTNMRITRFNRPSSSIRLVPGTGLSWTANNAGVTVNANWRITKNIFGFRIPFSGTLVTTAHGVSFSTTMALGKDSAGKPSIRSVGCTCTVERVNISFHNNLIAWILNIFRNWIGNQVRAIIPDKLCDAVREEVNVNAQRRLQELQVQIPLAGEFLLDYRLLSAPAFQTAYMDILLKGEITWIANPRSPPFSPRPLPQHSTAPNPKMLYLWIGEYVPQTFLWVAQEHGYLQHFISDDHLPPAHRGYLNLTCTGSASCIGNTMPSIASRYPGRRLELRLNSTSMPVVRMLPGRLTLQMAGDVAFYVNTHHGQSPHLFTLSVSAVFNMSSRITNQEVVGSIIGFSFSVTRVNSAVGQISSQVSNAVLNYALQNFIVPSMNEQGNRGFPLPVTDKFRLVNTQLQIQQNALMIGTDLRYQLQFSA